ncbi:MAG: glycine zipper 2TM domain-containing protein [Burkholderiaceae bacterium]
MKRIASLVSALAAIVLLTSCAAPGPQAGSMEIQQGRIEQISSVQIPTNHHQGLGAIVGGLGGLGIGSLIGAGTGRDVAMAVGAIGGALIGNEVQKKNDQPVPGQQIIVRLNSGVLVQITQPLGPYLSVGQRVYIQGSGEGARVIPQ